MSETGDDPWLGLDEVSDRLGIPRKTLLNWKYLGLGPPWAKFGKSLRSRLSWVVRWENDQAPKGA